MGNDGGSIPTRRELVKESSKPKTLTDVKEKQKEHLAHRWSQCPLSHTALKKPVVADYSGDLYNKESIIQYLLPIEVSSIDKKEAEEFLQGRVKGLKDVVEVQFEVDHDEKNNIDRWICPVTGKELGPAVKAVFIVPCGHAFSHEAIKEMKSNECVQCSQVYKSPRDIVPILPVSEVDKQFVIDRIETLRGLGLTHSLKKDKASKKRKAKDAVVAEDSDISTNGTSKKPSQNDKPDPPSSGLKNVSTASLTARVLQEEEAKKKRRLLNENENIQSLYSKSSGDKNQKNADFMTRGFSISAGAKDG